MNTTNNTILITGGGRGIGFAIAKTFAAKGNKVIIAGRNEETLRKAVAELPGVSYIVCDITSEADINALVEKVKKDFGGINVLVNNAGIGNAYQLSGNADAFTKAKSEMETNYFSLIRLTEKFLPVLEQNENAAIVNISSVVAYVPSAAIPTYSATKAAVHSYTQTLRITLQRTTPQIKVYEVYPPFVDTDLTAGFDIPKLAPSVIAEDLLAGMENEEYDIRNGDAKHIYSLSLTAPEDAFLTVNGEK